MSLFDPVEIERWLVADTMRKLDLMEHKRFMRELEKIALLDTVALQLWETKVCKSLQLKRAWV